MKIIKYTANSMPDAINQIRKELGPDAVILNSREIKQGGLFGMFKKRQIEVLAALDNQPATTEKRKQERTSSIEQNKTKNTPPRAIKNTYEDQSTVLREISHLKHMIVNHTMQSETQFPLDYDLVYNYLLEQEVNSELAKDIITSVLEQHGTNQVTTDALIEHVKTEINRRLHVVESRENHIPQKKIIQFVGPTGVGKTTTLAKVAANTMIEGKKKIAFITTDTYRIAAIDQLKTYAKILDVPIKVAYSASEYKEALHHFSHYDHIFVDTAGRNFREEKYLSQLRELIEMDKAHAETYLVLSLTAKQKDIIDIHHQFNKLPVQNIIFTKLDETETFGSLLNISIAAEKGITYITNGQDVPSDIITPTNEYITDLIVSRYEKND